MHKINRIFYVVLTTFSLFIFNNALAQCSVTSSTGYTVSLQVTPVSIIAPSTCPNGFNYNVRINYHVVFSGTNIPANLYTLQGNVYCGTQANFFSMPVTGGTGTVNSVSNPWIGTPTCATASINSLQCNSVQIIIQGPGINYQTFMCASGGPLPINLISFNGRIVDNNNVNLKWVTASEINNKSFTVERSLDSRTWQAIKTIDGAINSSTSKTYEYTDENLSVGMFYYRLKQTDISGAGTYSNIIAANITKMATSKDISVTYNGNSQILFQGLGNSAQWEISVFSSSSSVVFRSSSIRSSAAQLPALAEGIYFIKLRNRVSNEIRSLKFINR